MHFLAAALSLWALVSSAGATSIPVVERQNPAVVLAQLQRRPTSRNRLQTRDSPLAIQGYTLSDGDSWVNISLGTPPQPLSLLLDAGASDIWVVQPGTGRTTCDENRYCSSYGLFDPKNSSSFESISGDGKSPSEYWGGSDTLSIGGTELSNFSFSLASLDSPEAAYNSLGVSPENTSFPYQLVDRGLTNSPSFSVWGNETSPGEGGIIFGGVNTAKYHGPLQAFSFGDTPGVVSTRAKRLAMHTNNGSESFTLNYTLPDKPFSLQTRYITTYLPRDVAGRLYANLDIPFPGDHLSPEVDCSRKSENHTISLTFGNATISVPWGDFLRERDATGERCLFSISPTPTDSNPQYAGSIGFLFVQRMYLAVDYDNMFVGIAPLNPAPGPDRILEIGSGPRIPDAVGDFPETNTPYTPAPTLTVATSTSTGEAPMRTAFPGKPSANLISGVAGAVVLAMI